MIPRSIALRVLRLPRTPSYAFTNLTRHRIPNQIHSTRTATHSAIRHLATNKSPADLKIEEITELYATAQDEFEIAMEETEKVSVYAEEDRKAAREELEKVQAVYNGVVEGPDEQLAEEVKKRVGQRIRELENGVKNMEEMALNQD